MFNLYSKLKEYTVIVLYFNFFTILGDFLPLPVYITNTLLIKYVHNGSFFKQLQIVLYIFSSLGDWIIRVNTFTSITFLLLLFLPLSFYFCFCSLV